MKKLLFAIASVLIWSQMGITSLYAMQDEDEAIRLAGEHLPDPDLTRARSIGPNVTACLHHDMDQLEVAFENYLGEAAIEVLDWTGTPVMTYSCHTAMEWNVYLPIPEEDGAYTLKIYIANAVYVGNFVLMR